MPLQFAIELETAIDHQLAVHAAAAGTEVAFALLHTCQTGFLELLAAAQAIDVDLAAYPPVQEEPLLGAAAAWQQLTVHIQPEVSNLQELAAFWSIYAAIDKTVQFYQQAAANSAHPQTRLFFSSLSQVKSMLRRRLAGLIQIYYNHYWGEIGFAPFLLGKD